MHTSGVVKGRHTHTHKQTNKHNASPHHVHLAILPPPLPPNPGNHESITMNQMYGFEGEVKSKYSATMAELFTELFEWLPLAHCIEGKILVCKCCVFEVVNVLHFDKILLKSEFLL